MMRHPTCRSLTLVLTLLAVGSPPVAAQGAPSIDQATAERVLRTLASDEMQSALHHVASSPELRDAVAGLQPAIDLRGRRAACLVRVAHHDRDHVPVKERLVAREQDLAAARAADVVVAGHVFGHQHGGDARHLPGGR